MGVRNVKQSVMNFVEMNGVIEGRNKIIQRQVSQPKINSIVWIYQDAPTYTTTDGNKTNNIIYNKNSLLHITTEYEGNIKLAVLIVIHSDDWIEEYVALRQITQSKMVFNFIPKVALLKKDAIDESNVIASVYLLHNIFLSEGDNTNILKRLNESIKSQDNFQHYVVKPIIIHKKESEQIKIRKEINIPWINKAFEEIRLGVKEGISDSISSSTSPVKYLN